MCCPFNEHQILISGGFKGGCHHRQNEAESSDEPEQTVTPIRDCVIFDTRNESFTTLRGFSDNLIPVFAHYAMPGVVVQLVLDEANRDLLLLRYTSWDREIELIHRLELSANR